jgi:hypothetical protein
MLHVRLIVLAFGCAFTVAGCSSPGLPANGERSRSAGVKMISPNWPYEPPEQIDAELQSLHDTLGLAPAQQAQWDAFAQQVRSSSRQLRDKVADLEKVDPKLRGFGTYHELQRARMNVFDQVNPTYQQLYRVLSSNQQDVFTNLLVGPRMETCGLLCRAGIAQ